MNTGDVPQNGATKNIALTGATGFVGAAITDLLLAENHHVKVLARSPSRLHRPQDVEIITGDLADTSALTALSDETDALVHCAGLTHARRNSDFTEVNVTGARRVAHIFTHTGRSTANPDRPRRFVHISSLAARQPDISTYAASKYASEGAVTEAITAQNTDQVAWVTLRAPAMYGPRDTATLPFFKAVKRGLAPIPYSATPCHASILHVDDFARAVRDAITTAPANRLYEIGDDRTEGHSWREIAHACASSMEVTSRLLPLPKPLLLAWALPSSLIMRSFGKAPMVTADKIAEFFHPDWAARENLFADHTDWTSKIPLEKGFADTALWYQQHNLL